MANRKPMTYAGAGVHVKRANRLIGDIGRFARSTPRRGVVSGVGGFAAIFNGTKALKGGAYLVAATDGVGTKLELAKLRGEHKTIGVDLVAMSVNDLITVGAQPLFFLDYFATGRLKPKQLRDVLRGIAEGCKRSGCALIGGETAEMPGLYQNGSYDLAGFAVGVVKPGKIPSAQTIRPGDAVLGMDSSGVHSNGFSLVRKVFSTRQLKGALGRRLLKPTAIYVTPVRALLEQVAVKGLAHITGGGFYDNIPRVLPRNLGVHIRRDTWRVPDVFTLIQRAGRVSEREMFRTFNMGIGMVAILAPHAAQKAIRVLNRFGVRARVIGTVGREKGVYIQ